MKVCYVLGTTDGGTGRHVRMLAAGIPGAGVVGPAGTGAAFGFERFRPVEFTDRPRPAQDVAAVRRLRRLLRAGHFDVVHAHGLRAGALTALALTALTPAGRARRRPALVVTVHNAPPAGGLAGAVYRALELIVARRADSVLCVSADLEQRMRAAGARRVGRAVVPAPASPETAQTPASSAAPKVCGGCGGDHGGLGSPSQPPQRESAPVVLAVGRLAAQKGFDVLIDAAVQWRDVAVRVMIAGDGPLADDLAARARRLGVDVDFLGRRDDVPALLAGVAVFVLPSRWEGQSLILQEALRAGVPIVATRAGGNPDLVGEDAALLVPPGDPDALAGAVRAVFTDPALAAKLRAAALDRARTLPTERDALDAALREYQNLLPPA